MSPRSRLTRLETTSRSPPSAKRRPEPTCEPLKSSWIRILRKRGRSTLIILSYQYCKTRRAYLCRCQLVFGRSGRRIVILVEQSVIERSIHKDIKGGP